MSTKMVQLSEAIATRFSTISGLKVYTYEPRDLDSLPAITIDGPHFERVGPDEAESQLGSIDLHLVYIIRLYVAHDDPSVATPQIRQLMEDVIQSVEADRQLGNVCLDAVVSDGEYGRSESDETHQREYLMYLCNLRAWALA